MSAALVIVIGVGVASGVYLVTARSLSRIVLGFSILGHAAVLALLVSGGPAGEPPLADEADAAQMADPLPQALSLTAIVISFGLTLFLLALARRQHVLTGDDLAEDDLEDQRVAFVSPQATSEIEELAESEQAEAERAVGNLPPEGMR